MFAMWPSLSGMVSRFGRRNGPYRFPGSGPILATESMCTAPRCPVKVCRPRRTPALRRSAPRVGRMSRPVARAHDGGVAPRRLVAAAPGLRLHLCLRGRDRPRLQRLRVLSALDHGAVAGSSSGDGRAEHLLAGGRCEHPALAGGVGTGALALDSPAARGMSHCEPRRCVGAGERACRADETRAIGLRPALGQPAHSRRRGETMPGVAGTLGTGIATGLLNGGFGMGGPPLVIFYLGTPSGWPRAARRSSRSSSPPRARQREFDLSVAACALTRGAALWTLNAGDFRDIPGLEPFDPGTRRFSGG